MDSNSDESGQTRQRLAAMEFTEMNGDPVLIDREFQVMFVPAYGNPIARAAWEGVLSAQMPPVSDGLGLSDGPALFNWLSTTITQPQDRLTAFAKAWADYHDIKLLDASELPTEGGLARWLDSGEAHPEHILESETRLGDLCNGEGRWFPVVGKQNARLMAAIDGGARGLELLLPDDVLQRWESAPDDDHGQRPLNPVHPLLAGWFARPHPVQPNKRETGRILSGKLAHVEPADRRADRLFSPAAHVTDSQGQQLVLPGFGRTAASPALPLALYDLGGGPASKAQPAPLALRLFVEAILAVPYEARDRGQPVALQATLRELLHWLYPNERRPRPNEYWPRLWEAAKALDSAEARIPWCDTETGTAGVRRVVSITDFGAGGLEDQVRIIVDLPPGSGAGPRVSDNLRVWGARSAVGYRLLLNLAYRWWDPGNTVIPSGRGRNRRWSQVDDPARYTPIGDSELIDLAFPASSMVRRRHLLERARGALVELADAGELRIVDGKVLPPPRVCIRCQQPHHGRLADHLLACPNNR